MHNFICSDCGEEFTTQQDHDMHHESAHIGSKGGSSSVSNKARDAVEDVKNAAGDLGRDIRDEASDLVD